MKHILFKSSLALLCMVGLIGCSGGGETTSSSNPHQHSYSEWEYLNKDQHSHYCYLCDENVEGHYEVANHNWDEGILVNPATHTKKGLKVYTCTDCKTKYNEEIACLVDHVYDKCIASPTYLKEKATCTSPAVYYKSCICGAIGTETFTHGEPIAHNITSLTVSGVPTKSTYAYGEKFNANGLTISYTCADCDHSTPIDPSSLVAIYTNGGDSFKMGETSVKVAYGGFTQTVNGISVVKTLNTIEGIKDLTLNCCDEIDTSDITSKYGTPTISIVDKNNATVFDFTTLNEDGSPYTIKAISPANEYCESDVQTATITVTHKYYYDINEQCTKCACDTKLLDRYYYDLSTGQVNTNYITGKLAADFDPDENVVIDVATGNAPDWTGAKSGTNKALSTVINDQVVLFEGIVVDKVLKTLADVIDFGKNTIKGDSTTLIGGYYVLGCDVSFGGDTNITHANPSYPYFTGIFDGADHDISGAVWGQGLFGYVKNATFKNFSVTNLNAQGLFLEIGSNSTFKNIDFNLEGSISFAAASLGAGAYLCSSLGSSVNFTNCNFKYGEHTNALIADTSSGSESAPTNFKNVKVYSLETTQIFGVGEGGRPNYKGINYISVKDTCKLFYDTNKGAVITTEVVSELPGYSFASDEAGTAIDWSNKNIGEEFTIYALKDGSPTYMIPAVKTTRVITSWDDYSAWATSRNSSSSADTGYYVQTADFTFNPSSNIFTSTKDFKGTYDGRGHTVVFNKSCDYQFGLFSKINGGTILNLNVTNINRPYALAYELTNNTLIQNCTFTAATTIDRTGLGLLTNTAHAHTQFVKVTIDCGTIAKDTLYAIADIAGSTGYKNTYTDVTIKCLSTFTAYKTDNGDGNGVRPTAGVTYINTDA